MVALKARVCRLSLRSSFRGPWPGCVPASGRVSRKEDWGLRWEGFGEGQGLSEAGRQSPAAGLGRENRAVQPHTLSCPVFPLWSGC